MSKSGLFWVLNNIIQGLRDFQFKEARCWSLPGVSCNMLAHPFHHVLVFTFVSGGWPCFKWDVADFELTLIVIIMAAEMDHEARDCICSDQILIYYRITKKNNNNNIVTTCITKMPGWLTTISLAHMERISNW